MRPLTRLPTPTMRSRPALRLLPALLTAVLALAASATHAASGLVLTNDVMDATISLHPGLGGGSTPQGATDTLYSIVPSGLE